MPSDEQKTKVKEMLKSLGKSGTGYLTSEELQAGMIQIH